MMHQDAQSSLIILAGAMLLDLVFGEYPRTLHPVVWLGKLISAGVYLAPHHGWTRQFLYGAGLTIGVTGVSAGVAFLALNSCESIPVLYLVVGIFLLKASIALSELLRAARDVWQPLQQANSAIRNPQSAIPNPDGQIIEARQALQSLCSRDPSNLGPEELLQATIESLAENLCDSWVAPLFYFVLFGVPGAVAYRAVNTLDAMIGYRGRFEALGKFAARLDDVANWIPARLTAGLLLAVGFILRKDFSAGWRILRRDGNRTPSPNAGRPMAVMAGLLGVRLTKKDVYTLGDSLTPVTVEQARAASLLVRCAGWTMFSLTAGLVGLCVGEGACSDGFAMILSHDFANGPTCLIAGHVIH